MPHDPDKPLLRLNQPRDVPRRRPGAGGAASRKFERAVQSRAHGPIFRNLRNVLDAENPALQLRADPNSLAPERLLVFEVTGSVQNFATAGIEQIEGLEFAGEEELEADDLDDNPEFYLLVPQLAALREIVSLWERWVRTDAVPRNYGPWKALFQQLRDVRPSRGPADRVSAATREFLRLATAGAPDGELVRIEIELVFRASDEAAHKSETELTQRIVALGGLLIDRARHSAFAYHALLADVPVNEVRRIVDLDPASLAGADPVATIVPQSIGQSIEVADPVPGALARAMPGNGEPIAAVFDAVPLQGHASLLAGRLALDDPSDLETLAVGPRVHGTAMASLVLHGDLNETASPISRRVYFRPVMYAPAFGGEMFAADKLVVDVIVRGVL